MAAFARAVELGYGYRPCGWGPLVRTIRAAGTLDRLCIGSFSDHRPRRARAALGPRLCTSRGPGEVLRLRLAAWGLLPGSAVPSGPACVQIPVRRGFVPLAERRMLSCAHELGSSTGSASRPCVWVGVTKGEVNMAPPVRLPAGLD